MRKSGGRTVWKPILSGFSRRRRKHDVYSAQELRQLIIYERARADRTGDSLSVVLCEMNGENGSRASVNQAISLLARSIRHTDHLGWFDKRSLGVVLPLTSAIGAQRFVQTLYEGVQESGEREVDDICFTVYSYPEDWLQDPIESGSTSENVADHDSGCAMERHAGSSPRFTRPVPRWKRVLDLIGATAGLIVLSPLFAVLALYIKLISPGPVFFRQKRVGLARKEFDFFKFRTMHHNNKEEVHSHHAKDFIYFDKPMVKLDGIDPRIIKGGRILRKLAVDELPQLWNILKGDMTLVGPRPCIPYEADEYLQWHTDRFSILPGLTGLWQVSGKNKLTFQQMIRLDIEYVRRMSLWFDLWIILKTIPTVIGLGLEGTSRRLKLKQEKLQVQQEGLQDSEPSPVYELVHDPRAHRIAK